MSGKEGALSPCPITSQAKHKFAGVSASPESFRTAMSYMAAAVNIVTTNGPAGRAGFTASAVCSVSLDPPTLLVCLNKDASVSPALLRNGVLCVNTLTDQHQKLCSLFGGKTPVDERFAAATWESFVTGSPVLVGALASHDCKVDQVIEAATHNVLICSVLQTRASAQRGLVYFDRAFHTL